MNNQVYPIRLEEVSQQFFGPFSSHCNIICRHLNLSVEAVTLDQYPLLTNLNLTNCFSRKFKFVFFICHANMTTWVQFIAALAIIFSGLTSTTDASLRGRDTSVQTHRRFECPTETPVIGSTCHSVDVKDESPTCYFNFVKTAGPSPDESNFLPSIACSCRNVQWECDIAPDYLKALVEAASG
jgi:hypothetical protein